MYIHIILETFIIIFTAHTQTQTLDFSGVA